jgi:MSHA biogenesis protein MshM
MIRSFFGIDKNPFQLDTIALLPTQQDVYDTIKVHTQQGGLCLIMGEPGTGKSVIKEALRQNADKRSLIISVSRTMHTYSNTIKILCSAFNIDDEGAHFKCEKRIIDEAFTLNRAGKILLTIIDEAHLMDMDTLRKLRLMMEEFPKNHNLVLFGQMELIAKMALKVNDDIKSRITYSTTLKKLNPDDMETFILAELDKIGLGDITPLPRTRSPSLSVHQTV